MDIGADAPYTIHHLTLPLPAHWGTPAPEVFDYPPDAQSLTRFLAAPGHLLFLAYEGSLIIGQLTAYVHTHPECRKPSVFIDELGVTPSHQRRGVASALIDALVSYLPELGAEVAWVAAEPDNAIANALYAKLADRQETATIYTFHSPQTELP